jgi:hypothetical protein
MLVEKTGKGFDIVIKLELKLILTTHFFYKSLNLQP